MVKVKSFLGKLGISIGITGVLLFGSAFTAGSTASAQAIQLEDLEPIMCTPTQNVYYDPNTGYYAVFDVE